MSGKSASLSSVNVKKRLEYNSERRRGHAHHGAAANAFGTPIDRSVSAAPIISTA
jgi:hypothetical protein